MNDVGKIKYLPPVSKEWKNSVYNYNSNNNINYPVYNLNINLLIQGYFGLLINRTFFEHVRNITWRAKRKSLNKIFVSSAEVKHTNNKAIITLYVYNRERLVLLNKIKKLKSIFFLGKINILKDKLYELILKITSRVVELQEYKLNNNDQYSLNHIFYILKYKILNNFKFLGKKQYKIKQRLLKNLKNMIFVVRNLKLRLIINKYKFEEKFLFKLSKLISRYYGKKVEFNIVNLKSITYNTDIFTEILSLKLKKDKSDPMDRLNSLLSKVVLPKGNNIIERGRLENLVSSNLVQNKYKNTNINYIINKSLSEESYYKDNLNKLLYSLIYKTQMNVVFNIKNNNEQKGFNIKKIDINESNVTNEYYTTLRNLIFDNIKYKNIGGARLLVKGRLTKRIRADRAIYKLKWKGGLKNIDSSFKGLSTVVFRGYLDSNVERTVLNTKRKIGSFAVKGWFSGK